MPLFNICIIYISVIDSACFGFHNTVTISRDLIIHKISSSTESSAESKIDEVAVGIYFVKIHNGNMYISHYIDIEHKQ